MAGPCFFFFSPIHIHIPVVTTNGTLRIVHPQHATGAKAGWVIYTHSETIYSMGGIDHQTEFEKDRGLTNYKRTTQR